MNIFDEGVILNMIDYHLSRAIYFLEKDNWRLAAYHEAKADELKEKLDY